MCKAAMTCIYNGVCVAFTQTYLLSLPQKILSDAKAVDWRGDMQDAIVFWETVLFLFDMKLRSGGQSVYTQFENAKELTYGGFRGQAKPGKRFYLAYNNEVMEPDMLREHLPP